MKKQQVTLETPRGTVHIEGPVPGGYLKTLSMNKELKNFRPPERQKEALILITNMPDGRIYLARYEQEIIAYVAFHHPAELSRWSKHPCILEMGGIEVSHPWRQYHLAENMLKMAFSDEFVEDFIVITTEYWWHWDMKTTGLSVWEYQYMLSRLFSKVGLTRVTTDDPDIMAHPANVLMARIGKNVSIHDIALFEELRFKDKYKRVASFF